jgi:exopolysaccharide biosynthesis protein
VKKWSILLSLGLTLISSPVWAMETNSYSLHGKNVKTVWIDPSEEVELKPVLANNRVGAVDSFANIMEQNNALAGINGTYFNAYEGMDKQPDGSIMINGQVVHMGESNTTMGILPNHQPVFDKGDHLSIKGAVNGDWNWPNNWYAWGINHYVTDASSIEIYTTEFKDPTISNPGFTFVTVDGGMVTGKSQEAVTIPSNGYVIAFGPNVSDASKFKVGDRAEYRVELPSTLQGAKHLMGVGPKLVTNGQSALDGTGFSDEKLYQEVQRRSFIATTPNGTVILGSISPCTIAEEADIVADLGVSEAMQMDSGGSNGLMFKGNYLATPSRLISNALVVAPKEEKPIKIEVNGNLLGLGDAKPVMQDGVTLVPVRGVLESLGISVDWDNQNQQVMAKQQGKTIILPISSPTATVDGQVKPLLHPAQLIQNHTMVPLRFISENFGAKVEWVGSENLVRIQY